MDHCTIRNELNDKVEEFKKEFDTQVESISQKYENEIVRRHVEHKTRQLYQRCCCCLFRPMKSTAPISIGDVSARYQYDSVEGLDALKSYNGTPSSSVFHMNGVHSSRGSPDLQQRVTQSQPTLRKHVVEICPSPSRSCAALRLTNKPDLIKEESLDDDQIQYAKSVPALRDEDTNDEKTLTAKSCSALRHKQKFKRQTKPIVINDDITIEDIEQGEEEKNEAEEQQSPTQRQPNLEENLVVEEAQPESESQPDLNEEPEIKEEAPQTESSTILRRRLSQNKDMV